MALIGLVFLALTVIFLIFFSNPQDRQGEAFQLISGFMEVLIINCALIFALIILLSLLASVSASIPGLANLPIYGLGGLGVLQLLYVIPRSLYLKRRQRWARLKGVIAATVIVALLNGGCWIFMMEIGGI